MNMRTAVPSFLLAILATGCSIHNVKAPDRVFDPNMEESVRSAYLNRFDRLIVSRGGKPSQKADTQDDKSKASGPVPSTPSNPPAAQTTQGAVDEPRESKLFLQEGLGIANLRCDRYFDALGEATRQFNFARKEVTLTGAATAAVQGLTSVASRDIALTASGFGLIGTSLDNFADAFLFSPDINAVRVMVGKAQSAFADTIPANIPDLMEATKYLTAYESICTVDSIRHLVNQSISTANPVATFGTSSAYDDQIRTWVLPTLKAALSGYDVKLEEVPYLYWLTMTTDAAERQYIAAQMPNAKDIAGTALTDEKLKVLKAAFAGLPPDIKKKLDDQVATLKAARAGGTGTATGSSGTGTPAPQAGSGTPKATPLVEFAKSISPGVAHIEIAPRR